MKALGLNRWTSIVRIRWLRYTCGLNRQVWRIKPEHVRLASCLGMRQVRLPVPNLQQIDSAAARAKAGHMTFFMDRDRWLLEFVSKRFWGKSGVRTMRH